MIFNILEHIFFIDFFLKITHYRLKYEWIIYLICILMNIFELLWSC